MLVREAACFDIRVVSVLAENLAGANISHASPERVALRKMQFCDYQRLPLRLAPLQELPACDHELVNRRLFVPGHVLLNAPSNSLLFRTKALRSQLRQSYQTIIFTSPSLVHRRILGRLVVYEGSLRPVTITNGRGARY